MAQQPSYHHPLQPSSFFADGRSARPLVPGTVARDHLRTDTHFFTGKRRQTEDWLRLTTLVGAGSTNLVGVVAAAATETIPVDTFPFPITQDVMRRGQERYMIYCVVCHDALGTGRGKIVERGYTPPPSFHEPRKRQDPIGHFFDVITNGHGSMPDYKDQISPRDRWAIIAYVRALQYSQHVPLTDLPEEDRRHFGAGGRDQ